MSGRTDGLMRDGHKGLASWFSSRLDAIATLHRWFPRIKKENMSIDNMKTWHERARPNPTDKDFNVQLGCHLEEFVEMLDALRGNDERSDNALENLYYIAGQLARDLKSGELHVSVATYEREAFLDSLADQIVTATGVAHCAKMDITEACRRVNTSNWSKLVDGHPEFDKNGKIAKPPTYQPPNLDGLY